MSFSGFLKGEDITVVKNGSILGGIISIETEEKTTLYQTREFLSDKVVYERAQKSYIITLEMNVTEEGYFSDSGSVDLLEIHTENKRVRFYNCRLVNVKNIGKGGEKAVLRLVLECREREVV